MSNQQQNQLIVHMLGEDGQPAGSVDLATPEGANRFLLSANGNVTLTRFLEQCEELRQQMTGNNNCRRQAAHKLIGIYAMIYCLADETSDEAFAVLDSETELGALIRHIKDQMQKIVTTTPWKRNGTLAKHDEEMMACLIAFTMRLSFVKKALSEGVFECLVEWLTSIENHKLPSPEVTMLILSVVGNAHVSLLLSAKSTREAEEQSLKTLEKTGILTQVLRIITQPTPGQFPGHFKLLDDLAGCVNLVRKRFVEGQPGGDMLTAVLSGKDGFKPMLRRNPQVVRRLQNLQQIAGGFAAKPGARDATKSCRNCNKVDEDNAFMRCSICKTTYYCSKACQKADWKEHKKTCNPQNKREEKHSQSAEVLAFSYIRDRLFLVIDNMAEATRNSSNMELALELDFKADSTGVAPALQSPPVMKILPVKGYLEGKRENEPDWFFKGTSVYQSNLQQFLAGVRDQAQRMTDDRLLTIVRHSDGAPSVYRMLFQDPGTMQPFFAPAALDAYRRVILDKSAGPELLDTIFSPDVRDRILAFGGARTNPLESLLGGDRNPFEALMARMKEMGYGDDEDDDDDDEIDDGGEYY